MRSFGLGLRFAIGVVVAAIFVALPIFIRSLLRGARAFHPRGTVCRAEVTALDDTIGPRLAGTARIRLSSATEPENSPNASILGMAIAIDGGQDLPLATFESFAQTAAGTRDTDVSSYLANEYASVTPWRTGLGIVWFRAIPAAQTPTGATRVERLAAAVAADRARFVLEARATPGKTGALVARIAEIRLTEVLADDREIKISMRHTARGIAPTGFRNGVRVVAYPTSQLARRLRGG